MAYLEIDGLPVYLLEMVISDFPWRTVSHNQMVDGSFLQKNLEGNELICIHVSHGIYLKKIRNIVLSCLA